MMLIFISLCFLQDLFADFASQTDGEEPALDLGGMKALLDSVGERPSDDDLAALFAAADADGNGTVDMDGPS